MKQYIQGVWNTTGLGQAEASAVSLSVPQRESLTLAVDVLQDDGTVPDLSTGTLRFNLTSPIGEALVYTVTGAGTRYGTAVVIVSLGNNYPTGSYHWSLWLEGPLVGGGSNRALIVPMGSFELTDG